MLPQKSSVYIRQSGNGHKLQAASYKLKAAAAMAAVGFYVGNVGNVVSAGATYSNLSGWQIWQQWQQFRHWQNGFCCQETPNPSPHQLPSQARSLIARSNS
jgi:hypothetical protein